MCELFFHKTKYLGQIIDKYDRQADPSGANRNISLPTNVNTLQSEFMSTTEQKMRKVELD